ncbi:glycosyltransferase family 2 protein [Plicaturopsis crispa FD-325 SS-3]|nr:glycosyltransferase family 2 protein [Plicaturopsis crispa FD-325 SS-3]
MAGPLQVPEPSYFMSPQWKSNSRPDSPVAKSVSPGTPQEGSGLLRQKSSDSQKSLDAQDLQRSLFKLDRKIKRKSRLSTWSHDLRRDDSSVASTDSRSSRDTADSFWGRIHAREASTTSLSTSGSGTHSPSAKEPAFVRTELARIEEPYEWDPAAEDTMAESSSSETSSQYRHPRSLRSFEEYSSTPYTATTGSFQDEAILDENGDEIPQVTPRWEEVDPQIPTQVPNASTCTLANAEIPTTHPWVDAPPFTVLERPVPVIHKVRATVKITISLAIVISLIIGYAVKLKIVTVGFWSFGMYGLLLCIDFAVQATAASINRRRVNKIALESDVDRDVKTLLELKAAGKDTAEHIARMREVSIAVVGYREDEEAWIKCLQSLQAQEYPIKHIIGVVDGNDGPDLDMATAFGKAFPEDERLIVHLPVLLSVMYTEKYWETIKSMDVRTPTRWEFFKMWFTQAPREGQHEAHEIAWNHVLAYVHKAATEGGWANWKGICFSQPHGHKRHAMFTSFVVGAYALGTRDAMLTTDSDTYVHPDAVTHLLSLLMSDVRMAGVTGDVRIWNKDDSFLALMSSLRYWFAFNVERGCQSAFRCVGCLSGPLGLYKTSDLISVLGPWILQSFLGKDTTFGDDRHLTNRILSLGHWTGYSHLAMCESDTPAGFVRWVKQQTRWSKSFFREAFWFPKSFAYQQFWLTVETTKQFMYPMILTATVLKMVYLPRNWIYPLLWLATMFGVAFIKSTYGVICMRDPTYFLFGIYGFMYFFGLLPSKLFAGFTVGITTWGTSARSKSEVQRPESFYSRTTHVGHLVVWYTALAVGLAYFLSSIFQIGALWLISLLCVLPIIHLYLDVIVGESQYAYYLLKKWQKKRLTVQTAAAAAIDLEKAQGLRPSGMRMPSFVRAKSHTLAPSLLVSSPRSSSFYSRSSSPVSYTTRSSVGTFDVPSTIIEGIAVPTTRRRQNSTAGSSGLVPINETVFGPNEDSFELTQLSEKSLAATSSTDMTPRSSISAFSTTSSGPLPHRGSIFSLASSTSTAVSSVAPASITVTKPKRSHNTSTRSLEKKGLGLLRVKNRVEAVKAL